jgi:hypothetical protein
MPAGNWYWTEEYDGERTHYPLLGWALVERTNAFGEVVDTAVVGLDAEGKRAVIVPDAFAEVFKGYKHASEGVSHE